MVLPLAISAQTTGEKIENTVNTVSEVVEAIDGLGWLKKKNSTKSNKENGANSSAAGLLTVGKLTANTKYIECDYMEAFNKGAAIIEKGQQYALIDKNGNFIVPYGKFSGISTNIKGHENMFDGTGFFYATYFQNSAQKSCILNAEGKIVRMLNDGLSDYEISADKKVLIYFVSKQDKTSPDLYMELIDFNGKVYRITKEPSWTIPIRTFNNDVFIYGDNVNDQMLYGIKDINNKVLLKPTYNIMHRFSDGVAIVGKYNALNQMRFGIIDKTGKVLVQPSYEYQPGDFHTGLAIIRGADGLNTFINKNGKIIYKTEERFPWVKNGIIFERKAMIDTLGKVTSVLDFIKPFKIMLKPNNEQAHTSFQKGYEDNENQMVVEVRAYSAATGAYAGTYDFSSGTMIYMPSNMEARFSKDNVSGLIHVVMEIDQRTRKEVEGYLNDRGEFVFIKKPTANTGL